MAQHWRPIFGATPCEGCTRPAWEHLQSCGLEIYMVYGATMILALIGDACTTFTGTHAQCEGLSFETLRSCMKAQAPQHDTCKSHTLADREW